MKISELRNKTENELNEALKKLKADIKSANLDLLQKKEKNIRKSYTFRKNIARVLTLINEKKTLKVTKRKKMPKRIFKGTVVSNKMQKTLVVSVDVPKKHKFYSKDIKLSKKLKASDGLGCLPGDIVYIEESRPLGKNVSWKVLKKAEKEKD